MCVQKCEKKSPCPVIVENFLCSRIWSHNLSVEKFFLKNKIKNILSFHELGDRKMYKKLQSITKIWISEFLKTCLPIFSLESFSLRGFPSLFPKIVSPTLAHSHANFHLTPSSLDITPPYCLTLHSTAVGHCIPQIVFHVPNVILVCPAKSLNITWSSHQQRDLSNWASRVQWNGKQCCFSKGVYNLAENFIQNGNLKILQELFSTFQLRQNCLKNFIQRICWNAASSCIQIGDSPHFTYDH